MPLFCKVWQTDSVRRDGPTEPTDFEVRDYVRRNGGKRGV